ncbi:hypothetical protein IWQ60_011794 [Tieghemiomyces parasiticus]|uniref:Uncharacterized protein n=1 Tax=Tieghemiomyces parasiticus TaxID=78921 RepID=A0A9W7ZNB5_9FUNG|nr:hypothetical protein IWQ60_011794 [Tieghemiomyces parasiticus]
MVRLTLTLVAVGLAFHATATTAIDLMFKSSLIIPPGLECVLQDYCRASDDQCYTQCLHVTVDQYRACSNSCSTKQLQDMSTNDYILAQNCLLSCVDSARRQVPFDTNTFLKDPVHIAQATLAPTSVALPTVTSVSVTPTPTPDSAPVPVANLLDLAASPVNM